MYTDKERYDDFHWFIENYYDFYNKYGKCFIAIKDKIILGIYDSFEKALSDTSSEYVLGTFIIQECNGDESAYRADVPSLYLTRIK